MPGPRPAVVVYEHGDRRVNGPVDGGFGHRLMVAGSLVMKTAAVLAALDGLAGLYLIGYGISRERRDAAGVIIVGGVLMACALSLAALTLI